MKTKKGFTLLELVVVVLIIGILAAVALPQYRKAIEHSKGVQAITLLKSIGEASSFHYLSTGTWPSADMSELPVSIPQWVGTEKIGGSPTKVYAAYDWNFTVHASVDGGWQYRMERLKGPFRGAGFVWNQTSAQPLVNPVGKVFCVELISAIPTPGSYCAKIFKGTKTDYSGASRNYILP